VRNLHDPEQNIQGGVRHLKNLLDHFKSVKLAVAAYNAGAGAVRRYRGVPPYRETRRYVEKVIRYHAEYQRDAVALADTNRVNAG
jgi:soluble lytic murein transglycosylase-like protein